MIKQALVFLLLLLLVNCNNSPKQKEIENLKTAPIETGHYTEAYPNGNLKIKGDLVKGTRQGKWTAYYEDGKVWSENNYIDGKKNGETKSFYPNGNLRFLGHYKNDKRTNQWFFYNKNGQFEKEIDFTAK